MQTDHLGSVALTSKGWTKQGNIRLYYPFGEERAGTNPTATERGFTGHQENRDVGLTYMNARYYVPNTNRMLSPDSIIPDPMNPQSFNRYSYVLNNPINYTDPTGHIPEGFDPGRGGDVLSDDEILQAISGMATNYDRTAAEDMLVDIFNYFMREYEGYETASGWNNLDGFSDIQTVWFAAQSTYHSVAANNGGEANAAVSYFSLGALLELGAESMLIFAQDLGGTNRFATSPCHSFSADTLVLTENGYVPIAELEIGDIVYAYNEATDRMDYYPVTATWEHLDPVIVHVTIDGEVIETTPWHLFYTAEGWVEAGDLWLDAEVFTADSDYGRVQNLTIINEPQWMYDITVDVAHTFFIGDGEWLVHNCTPSPRSIRKSIRSLENRITEHEDKLAAYIANPYAYDNRGFLQNAPNQAVRQRIIQGRINHLQNEINTWRRRVDELRTMLNDQ